MGPIVPLLLQALPWLVDHGGDIKQLISAGVPVEQAIVKQAPQLWDALKKIAPALAPHPGGDEQAAQTLALGIFAPHMTTGQERAWMDRASQTTGL